MPIRYDVYLTVSNFYNTNEYFLGINMIMRNNINSTLITILVIHCILILNLMTDYQSDFQYITKVISY